MNVHIPHVCIGNKHIYIYIYIYVDATRPTLFSHPPHSRAQCCPRTPHISAPSRPQPFFCFLKRHPLGKVTVFVKKLVMFLYSPLSHIRKNYCIAAARAIPPKLSRKCWQLHPNTQKWRTWDLQLDIVHNACSVYSVYNAYIVCMLCSEHNV